MALIEVTKKGLYCPQADLFIDPWRAVPKALITHAHSDHARSGNGLYLAHEHCVPILKSRLGRIQAQGYGYGMPFSCNGVRISFHPAGHVPGSAQIRLEWKGEVWVVSGDYKLEDDGLTTPYEPVKCHHFITESTFALPIYRWRPQQQIFDEMNHWWAMNAAEGRTSVIMAYSLGKAQRILKHLNRQIGPVLVHPAVEEMNSVVRSMLPALPETIPWQINQLPGDHRKALLFVPPGAADSWLEPFRPYSVAFVSGWMNLRGAGKRFASDRGFVLSDHADWPGLLEAIEATEAERIYVTHGYTASLVRWLKEQGREAFPLKTLYDGEAEAAAGWMQNL
ncbi:MAG: ligase-associated DNA damage response exonuclease [Bacteroidia bacterium]|nr:ligase-associated DNA damage response exonuclease [Bacteroidia bacterium]